MIHILGVLIRPGDEATLRSICENSGYRFSNEFDFEKAVEAIKDRVPDLVICEISLPSLKGVEFLKRVKEDLKEESAGVVITSRHYSEKEINDLLGAHIIPHGFIRIPISREEAEKVIERAVKGGGIGKKIIIEDTEPEDWERFYPLTGGDLAKGRLSDIRPYPLLYFIALNDLSGVLNLSPEMEKTRLFFFKGVLENIESGWKGYNPYVYLELEKGLETSLLRGLKREAEAAGEGFLNHMIVKGILSPHEVAAITQQLYRVMIARISDYMDGEYSFDTALKRDQAHYPIPLEIPITRLMIDCLKGVKTAEWFSTYYEGISGNHYDITYDIPISKLPFIPDPFELKILEKGGEMTVEEALEEIGGAGHERRMKVMRSLVSLHFTSAIESIASGGREDMGRIRELKREKRRLGSLTPENILAIREGAGPEEIKKAFLELSRKYHPDSHATSNPYIKKLLHEIFLIISSSYESLLKGDTDMEEVKKVTSEEEGDTAWRGGMNPFAAKIEFTKGRLYYRNKKFQEALEHFRWAIQLNPKEAEYRAYYGWTLFLKDSREAETAEREIEEAVKMDEGNQTALLFKGYLLKMTGRIKEAQEVFGQILSRNPGNIEAMREVRLYEMRRSKEREKEKKGKGLFSIFRKPGRGEEK